MDISFRVTVMTGGALRADVFFYRFSVMGKSGDLYEVSGKKRARAEVRPEGSSCKVSWSRYTNEQILYANSN